MNNNSDVNNCNITSKENAILERNLYNFSQDKNTISAKLGSVISTLNSLISFFDSLDIDRDYYKKEIYDALYYCLEQVCFFSSFIYVDEFEKYQKERSAINEDYNN